MFLGHIAAGLMANRLEPRLRPGTAMVAAQLPDVVWPFLVLAGVESVRVVPGHTEVTPLAFDHYPWSHSLLMTAFWGAAMALACRRAGRRAMALVVGLSVSHWLLDFVTHRPDLPLVPGGGPLLGLGLWNHLVGTMALELGLFAAAIQLLSDTPRLTRSLASLLVVLTGLYVANIFGPPPPGPTTIAVSMIAFTPLVWWWGNRSVE